MGVRPVITRQGNVVSSALSFGGAPDAQNSFYAQNSLIEGQIVKINPSTPERRFVLYDVLVRQNDGSTSLVPDCRALQPLSGGSQNNFVEIVPKDPGEKATEAIDRQLKPGTMVLVSFVSGQATSPVIVGALPHTSDRAAITRPTENSALVHAEFQGLNFQIKEDGSFNMTFNGPRTDEGELENENGPTAVNIDADGNVLVSNNNEQSIEISRTTEIVTVTSGPTKVVLNKKDDKIQVQAENVEIGDGGLQPAVVGDDWKAIMEELIDALLNQTHPTPVGPSGTPINAPQFNSVKNKLKNALSEKHKIEK